MAFTVEDFVGDEEAWDQYMSTGELPDGWVYCERCDRPSRSTRTHHSLGVLCNDDGRLDCCWDDRLEVTA